jgi:hypothetical protein
VIYISGGASFRTCQGLRAAGEYPNKDKSKGRLKMAKKCPGGKIRSKGKGKGLGKGKGKGPIGKAGFGIVEVMVISTAVFLVIALAEMAGR